LGKKALHLTGESGMKDGVRGERRDLIALSPKEGEIDEKVMR